MIFSPEETFRDYFLLLLVKHRLSTKVSEPAVEVVWGGWNGQET
jgi:hypothetical protein